MSDSNDFFWGMGMGGLGAEGLSGRLRHLREANRRALKRVRRSSQERRDEIKDLRAQVEFLSLALTSVIAQLDHKGALTRDELREVMISVDEYDGELDGRLPVEALEELLRPPVLEEIFEDDEPPSQA